MLWLACYAGVAQQKNINGASPEISSIYADTTKVRELLNRADTLMVKQQHGQALQYAKEALLLSHQASFEHGLMQSNFSIGEIYRDAGKGDSSKQFFTWSREYAYRLRDTLTADRCIREIAHLYKYQLLFNNDSMVHYYKMLLHSSLHGDSAALNQLYFDVAYAYYQRVLVDSALKYMFLSLQLAEKRKDTSLIIISLCGRSAIWNSTQHYLHAKQAVEQAISMLDEDLSAASELSIVAYITQGWIYEKSGNYDSLFLNSNKILSLLQKKEDPYYIGLMHYRLAVYYNSINKPDKALGELRESLRDGSLNDVNFLSCAYREMGRSYALKELTGQAITYLNKSIENASKIHDPGELMETYELLWQVYMQEHMYKPAMDAYIQYNLFKDSIAGMHNIASMNLLSTQYEFGKKEDEIKLLSAENELKTALAQKENQRKNFALAGIGILLLAGGYGFYWFRKKKQFQNEQNLVNERLRISRELHDEVGATLSGVVMYSYLTKTQLQAQDLAGVENSLNIMQDSSSQMVNKLNDIVWLINPDKSSLPDLMQRLEEYARNMAAAKNMEVKVNTAEAIQQLQLTMDQRRNIYLFCKEAINNAVKYSEGTLLELSVQENRNLLELSVCDNGKGFDPGTVKRGNGLDNLQKRAKEIGANYFVKAEKDKGCTVDLQLKCS